MWDSDVWKQFLSEKCKDYSQINLHNDAKFLADQNLGPSHFDRLIEIYERDGFGSFKQCFPNFTVGNLIGLINGLKDHVREKGDMAGRSETIETMLHSECSSQPKKLRLEYNGSPCVSWLNKVKKYMFYFVRKGGNEEFPKRCVCAISPTIAVTFSHGRNKCFKSRAYNKKKLIAQGTILDLHSLYDVQHKVKAEVVSIVQPVDFILLEALGDTTFFDGDPKENNLEDPVSGLELLAIGLSSHTESQEAITTGVVLSTSPFDDHQMVSNMIAWGGDSGAGLFSRNNKVLGIVTVSQESDEGEMTRTYFAPSNEIRCAWHKFLVETGKMEPVRGIRRSDE